MKFCNFNSCQLNAGTMQRIELLIKPNVTFDLISSLCDFIHSCFPALGWLRQHAFRGYMTLSHSPKQNRILAGLPPAAYARLLPDLDLVSLPVGEGVYEPDIHITHLYFPVGCILARLYELESGASVKTSITGNEGMVGISYVLGSESTSARTVALNEGNAFRIKAPLLKKNSTAAEICSVCC